MKDKNTIINIAIIAVLVVVLGVMWFFIINALMGSENGDVANMESSSSASYSAVKEITSDEEIDGEEFASTSRILRPWDFPGKSTGVGCHRLLHDKILQQRFKKKN